MHVVLKEIKNDGHKNLIMKATATVKRVRVSSVATEKLIERCNKTVLADCTTRWNSDFPSYFSASVARVWRYRNLIITIIIIIIT